MTRAQPSSFLGRTPWLQLPGPKSHIHGETNLRSGRHRQPVWPSRPLFQKGRNSNVAIGAASFAQCFGPSSRCRFLSWKNWWRKSVATAGAQSMSSSTKSGCWPGLFLMFLWSISSDVTRYGCSSVPTQTVAPRRLRRGQVSLLLICLQFEPHSSSELSLSQGNPYPRVGGLGFVVH